MLWLMGREMPTPESDADARRCQALNMHGNRCRCRGMQYCYVADGDGKREVLVCDQYARLIRHGYPFFIDAPVVSR